jgi:hypothetical protein
MTMGVVSLRDKSIKLDTVPLNEPYFKPIVASIVLGSHFAFSLVKSKERDANYQICAAARRGVVGIPRV